MMKRAISMLLAAGLLAACEEPPPPVKQQVRAIKTITVNEVASGSLRKFSGVLQAADSSALSFEVSGNVKEVRVDLGAEVEEGQTLAVLDNQPYALAVQGAEANLSQNRADLEQARLEFDRKKKLYEKDWVSKAAYDQARAAFESASSAVKFAQSQLNLARRDLAKTTLKAPFAGVIAKKDVEPFVDVKSGQQLFEINAKGALEVALEIPETVIKQVTIGTPVTIAFPTEKTIDVLGRVTEVGSVAADANAFPVTTALLDSPSELRAGMTAEVTFNFHDERGDSGFLIPLTAIAPGEESRQGYIFVFDRATSTVKRTLVRGRDVRDNMVIIQEGLRAGDIIATAGVTFLHDGQKVTLMTP